MRAASVALIAHLAGNSRTMAYLWKVTRTDAQVFGFTNHDADIIFDGLTYVANLGVNASTVQTSAGLSVDNLDVTGFLSSGTLTAADVKSGLWDHADVRLMECNWADISMGVMKTKRGWIGQVKTEDGAFSTEFRGLSAALNASIGEVTGPGCTARLGDARCKVSLSDYTTTGIVTATDSDGPDRVFDTDLSSAIVSLTPDTTGAPDDAYFNDGLLTWSVGANVGLQMDVKRYTVDGRIELHLPMPNAVEPSDEFVIVAGCTKSLDGMCVPRFDNAVNFRGFPFIPGLDATLKAPGQSNPEA